MRSDSYKNYLLGVLVVASVLNSQDRLALGIVLQNIKLQFSLSDTQLGLLTGIAFAVFYSVAGIPLARWVDRGNRVTVISVTLALWSLMVSLSGLAKNFVELLLMRMCVAVGEAGYMPVVNSIIPDYFRGSERLRANTILLLGPALSNVIGYWLAGWLNQIYGWRVMFMVLGLPGLGLAALVRLSLREPRNDKPARNTTETQVQIAQRQAASSPGPPSLREAYFRLWSNRTFRHLLLCFAVSSFFSSSIYQWQAPFLIRSYGLRTGEIGVWLAGVYGVGSLVGTYLGGHLAARYAPNNERLQLKAAAVCILVLAVLFSSLYLSHNIYWAFVMLGITQMLICGVNPVLFAVVQSVVPERTRAISIAIMFLCANLIGAGLGPLAIGAVSDTLHPWVGEDSLRYALLAMCPGYWWVSWHLWRSSESVTTDLAAMGQVDEQAIMMKSVAPSVSCGPQ